MLVRLSLIALFASFIAAAPAAAYCRLTTESPSTSDAPRASGCFEPGIKLAWKQRCVSYTVVPSTELDLDLDEVRATVERSFQSWMDVSCPEPAGPLPITFGQTEEVGACDLGEYNRFGPNANTIAFISDWESRGRDYVDDAYGVTLVWHNPNTGEILDADIHINLTLEPVEICGEQCDGRYVDLENVVTHEVGHFLGLAHSEFPDATMYRDAPVAQVAKRSLWTDDVDGACAIYGEQSPMMCEEKDYAPRRGFTKECSKPMESSSCALRSGPVGRGALAAFMLSLVGFVLLQRRRLTGLLAALPLLLIAGKASAFCQLTTAAPSPLAQCSTEGQGLEWTRPCVSYTVVPLEQLDLDLDAVRNTIDEAFGAWTTVDCGGSELPLVLGQTERLGACTTAQYNTEDSNANLIMFLDEWDSSELPAEVFALTLVWHSPKTGQIFDVDMQLNATIAPFAICGQSCSGGVSDLANVVTHEAGHFLGLGHSHIPDATMASTAILGDIDKRTLESDDREGICAIYGARPAASCEPDDFSPDRGFTPSCVVELPPCSDAGAGEECDDEEPAGEAGRKAGGGSSSGGCAVRGAGQSPGALSPAAAALIALIVVARRRRLRGR